jgi:hypothetical protein
MHEKEKAKSEQLDVAKISEIIGRGNTAEVKKTKGGVTILEVSRKIRYRETGDAPSSRPPSQKQKEES